MKSYQQQRQPALETIKSAVNVFPGSFLKTEIL